MIIYIVAVHAQPRSLNQGSSNSLSFKTVSYSYHIKPICEQWFEKLPDVYHEFYNKVFENNMKYIFSREIEYCIDYNKDGYLTVIANARVYVGKNNSLDITYKKPISKDFSDEITYTKLRKFKTE